MRNSILLKTLALSALIPFSMWGQAAVFEDFQYEITAENTVTITGYTGANTEVSIPSEIEGLPVTSVGIRAFMGSDLTRIVIPDSVTEISSGAFNGCVSLSEVKIPNSVTTIGGYAFSLCKSLEEVVIPASVTLIDEEAFRGCESLSKVYLRGRELTIKSLAFADCPQLEGVYSYSSAPFEIDLDYRKGTYPYPFDSTVVVYYPAEYEENWTQTVEVVPVPGAPDTDWVIYTHSITNIQPWDPVAVAGVFEDFQYEITAENTVTITGYTGANTEVSIPAEIEGLPVTSVGASAFVESQLLESVVLPEGVLSVGKEAFRYCENLRSVSLPESLQNLGRNAFEYCYALEEISIPANVETLNEGDNSQPFKFCESLVSIEVDPDNRNYKSEEGVLFSKDGKTLIAYPGSRVGESYQIQEGVEKLGDYAFCKAQNLQEVTLGEDVEEIGAFCFAVMPALVNINFNEKVRVLGMGAFRANESLEEITLPDSVEELGIATFTDCGSLSRVTIGKGISKLDYFQFSGSLNLAEVAVSEENPNYSAESGVVYDKEKTTLIYYPPARAGEEFEVPAGIKRVEMEMNSGNLKRLILPATVSSFNVCWKEEEMALEDIYFKGASPDMESTILPASDKVEYHYLEGMGGWKENDSPDNWPKSTFGFEYSPQLNFTIWSLPEDSAELYIGKREQSAEGKNTLNLVFGGMLESSVDQQTWSEVTSVSPYQAEIDPDKKVFYRVRALTAE